MRAVAVISGVGLVSALGASAEETWQALLEGRCVRSHVRVQPEACIAESRAGDLGVQAAREALNDAEWAGGADYGDETAIVVGTSKGPIERWCESPALTSDNVAAGEGCFGLASVADDVARHTGFGACRRLTVSAACASGLIALARGAMMIEMGEAQRVLVLAAEASVHPLFVGSFRRLGVLADEGELCRPFDKNRSGFLMSEAAAAICLERMEVGETSASRRSRPRVAIDGFCMAGEARHLVAGDPSGITLERMLNRLMRQRGPDLIHAHGTGTGADAVELAAIERSLERVNSMEPPIVYSHKGALGHTLGAAGLVSVAINYRCHVERRVPGNINTPSPLPMLRAIIRKSVVERTVRRSIACAAGFGGAVAAVGLSTV